MGLFDQITRAIDNPSQQGSTNQIGSIVNLVQQMSGNQGVPPSATQAILSIVGNHVRSALQEKRSVGGYNQAEAIVDQYSGTQPNSRAVQSLFTPQQQQAVVQDAAQRTGLDFGTIQSMLPVLVPLVLNLLQTGANNRSQGGYAQNPTGQRSASNSVLSSFLDADNSGEVDVGDAISIASQFLNRR